MFGWATRTVGAVALIAGTVSVAAPIAPVEPVAATSAAIAPTGFVQVPALRGLSEPTTLAFLPDGRVLVAEKAGTVQAFDSLTDPTPSRLLDLRSEVYSFLDHGLLGMAVDPNFAQRPYLYLLFTRDARTPGGPVGAWHDDCASTQGCVTYSRLMRYTISNGSAVNPVVLIDDWCNQFGSHGIGALAFGADGALYAGGGDGAAYHTTDWGQFGAPANPCADPPGGLGVALTMPTAEGGSLRSQDVRTAADPTGLSGSIVRVDPDTGSARTDNPAASASDPNTRRIVAFGVRNPFRVAFRPGTNELYVGDVGWNFADEIDRVDATDGGVDNFGWPCFEDDQLLPAWYLLDTTMCAPLYAQPSLVRNPAFAYRKDADVVPGDSCGSGAAALSGLAFASGTAYPAQYRGGLFFADYSRQCIWYAPPGSDGRPDFSATQRFLATPQHFPVDLVVGPTGELFYPDVVTGEIVRIAYAQGNHAPNAMLTATPPHGAAPLRVTLDATESSDPDPADTGTLTWRWDLDDDGSFDDATGPTTTATFTVDGSYRVAVAVSDTHGAATVASTIVLVGMAPEVAIVADRASWAVGDLIGIDGFAVDPQDGVVAADTLHWQVTLQHCDTPQHCHAHPVATFDGVSRISITAPDHAYPAYLDVSLSATDTDGHTTTTTRRLSPTTTLLRVSTMPFTGSVLVDGVATRSGAATRVIVGSSHVIAVPDQQIVAGATWSFARWSDGGARTRTITATANTSTYAARYTSRQPPQYRIIGRDGSVGSFGLGVRRLSVAASSTQRNVVVGAAAASDGNGWWTVDARGTVRPGGAARHFGDTRNLRLHAPIVAMASTPSGRGYWLAASDGGVFAFGDARFRGSLGALRLDQPIVAMIATPTGRGYRLVAADGGVFVFGDATFAGSLGGRPSMSPVTAVASSRSGRGYSLLHANGTMHHFGDARGFPAPLHLQGRAAVALVRTPTGRGYWMLDDRGGVHAFGDAPRLGSATHLAWVVRATALA